MQYIQLNQQPVPLQDPVGGTVYHVLDKKMIQAINAALAINRPLLVMGEPGIGKSQLAKAAALALKRALVPFVVDARTEARDLLWRLDAVARLARAQISGALLANSDSGEANQRPQDLLEQQLAEKHFIAPGPLWWAFNWQQAKARRSGGWQPGEQDDQWAEKNGVVVLIDEIDKADSDVPNGLLEALGAQRFVPQGMDQAVECGSGNKPLVIITSNQERPLPDAFVRRCLVLYLDFPDDPKAQVEFLVERAQKNQACLPGLNEDIFRQAAEDLVTDRSYAEQNNFHPLPGQAEYFDLLRGVQRLSADQGKQANPEGLIQQLRRFTYQKAPVEDS